MSKSRFILYTVLANQTKFGKLLIIMTTDHTVSGLWGLVNNAGIICPMGPFHWLTRDDLTNVLNVNLLGAIEMTNMLYPLLRTAKGRVVNVSSAVALFPTAGTIYSVSKAGIEAFSDNIRLDSTFTVILFKREQLYHWMWKVTIIFILVQVTCMVELVIG